MDRAQQGMLYHGEVREGLDPCIPAGARFSLFLSPDGALFEPALPVGAPVQWPSSGPCPAAARYFLAAKGRGEQVRLRPIADLVGAAQTDREPRGPGARGGLDTAPSAEQHPTGANVTIGAPSLPDGTSVLVLGSIRDLNLRLWHHVQALADPAQDAGEQRGGGPGGEPVSAGPRSTSDRGSDERSAGGERDGADDRGIHGARRTPAGGASTKGGQAGLGSPGKGPASGYVPAENLVVRWECRLDRAPPRSPQSLETTPR